MSSIDRGARGSPARRSEGAFSRYSTSSSPSLAAYKYRSHHICLLAMAVYLTRDPLASTWTEGDAPSTPASLRTWREEQKQPECHSVIEEPEARGGRVMR